MEFELLENTKVEENLPAILLFSRFEDNDKDHFFTISTTGFIKEFIITETNSSTPIDENVLYRPGNELLSKFGHTIPKDLNSNQEIRITKIIRYDNKIVLGYEDGLVTVFSQEKREIVPKKMIKEEDKEFNLVNTKSNKVYEYYKDSEGFKNTMEILDDPRQMEFRSYRTFFRLRLKNNFCDPSESKFAKMEANFKYVLKEKIKDEDNKKYDIKNYYNIFWLDFIFGEQSQSICDLLRYNITKDNFNADYLISSSMEGTVKVYDLISGETKYSLEITEGFVIMSIIFKQRVKNPEGRNYIIADNVNLITNSGAKINLNFWGEKYSLSVNHFIFKLKDLNNYFFDGTYFYLLDKYGVLYILNDKFEELYEGENTKKTFLKLKLPTPDSILFMTEIPNSIPFAIPNIPNLYILYTSKLHVLVCNIDVKSKKLDVLFYVKIGDKKVSDLIILEDKMLYLPCLDGIVYSFDIANQLEIYQNRRLAKLEEDFSIKYNAYYEKNKGKKKKGKKGKKGKKAGGKSGKSAKSPEPKKKAKSPAKPKAKSKSPTKAKSKSPTKAKKSSSKPKGGK